MVKWKSPVLVQTHSGPFFSLCLSGRHCRLHVMDERKGPGYLLFPSGCCTVFHRGIQWDNKIKALCWTSKPTAAWIEAVKRSLRRDDSKCVHGRLCTHAMHTWSTHVQRDAVKTHFRMNLRSPLSSIYIKPQEAASFLYIIWQPILSWVKPPNPCLVWLPFSSVHTMSQACGAPRKPKP